MICGGSDYSTLAYILPHFYDTPDLVLGHMGGIKVSVPYEIKDTDKRGDLIPAPEFGEWVVVLLSEEYG